MQQKHHTQEKVSWYQKVQRSWVVNTLIIPIVIALLCGLIIAWLK
jgi:hypothetical protein